MRRRSLLDGAVEFCEDAYDACRGAIVIVIVTEWDELRGLDFARMEEAAAPILVDLRNIYGREDAARQGFACVGVGR